MPDCAIFADTQAEPQAVYSHLDWLCSGVLPFQVHRVTAGSLYDVIGAKRKTGKWPHLPIPAFISGANGERVGMANRSCTQDYKIRPIRRKVRELCGLTHKRSPSLPVVTQWIGISKDEAHRMKDARESWIVNRWPLIELGMTRNDCLRWMADHKYPAPPKSSCTFCPYHDRKQWAAVMADPQARSQAVDVDERIRTLWHGRVPGELYLHRKLLPLVDAVGTEPADEPNLFGNECEGVCGV